MRGFPFAAALAALVLLPGLARADGSIVLGDAWSRAAPAGRVGVVYLTIADHGAPDRLLSVASPVAASAELHESIDDHGTMKMRPVDNLELTAGQTVKLAPGGYHIMLMGLKRSLKQGESFPLTLTFEKAGALTVNATVARAGASSMPMQHDMGAVHNMPMNGTSAKP